MWMILTCILPSKRSQVQDYLLYEPICITFWKMQNYKDGKQLGGCQQLGEGDRVNYKEASQGNVQGDGTVLYRGAVMTDPHLYEFV